MATWFYLDHYSNCNTTINSLYSVLEIPEYIKEIYPADCEYMEIIRHNVSLLSVNKEIVISKFDSPHSRVCCNMNLKPYKLPPETTSPLLRSQSGSVPGG